MNIEHLNRSGVDIAVISGDGKIIVDVPSALDLAMTVKYETGAASIVLDKALVCEDFFILSTGGRGGFFPVKQWDCRGNPAKIYQLPCAGRDLRRLLPLQQ